MAKWIKIKFINFLNIFFIYFGPLATLILASIFVLIKPALHGLILGLALLLAFSHIRNFLNGRIINSNEMFSKGQLVRISDKSGIITEIGKLGLRIRSDDGLHYFPYQTLLTSGYTLSSGDKIGGYYHLSLRMTELMDEDQMENLTNIILSSPYLDGDHKPEFYRSLSSEGHLNIKVLVKEEVHLHELMKLLEENGFDATLSKS